MILRNGLRFEPGLGQVVRAGVVVLQHRHRALGQRQRLAAPALAQEGCRRCRVTRSIAGDSYIDNLRRLYLVQADEQPRFA